MLSLSSGMQISIISLTITISSLVARAYAPRDWMLSFPMAAVMLGMVVMTFPASAIFSKIGRKSGFILAAITAICGAGILALMMLIGFWWGIILGYFVVGLGLSAGTFYIYAANDGAPAEVGGRISGCILLGGLLAAFIGPASAHFAQRTATETPLLAVPLLMMGFGLLVLILIMFLKKTSSETAPESLDIAAVKRVLGSVYFWAAALVGACGYGAMTLAMNATTPWMFDHGMVIDHSAVVISLHLLGMFAPAPVGGWISDRFGATFCGLLGFAMMIACMMVLMFGHNYAHFMTALVLLGIGWSMTMVAGTKKLVALGKVSDRAACEAGGSLLISLANIFSALTAGAIYIHLGGQGVLIITGLFVALGIGALISGAVQKPYRA